MSYNVEAFAYPIAWKLANCMGWSEQQYVVQRIFVSSRTISSLANEVWLELAVSEIRMDIGWW
jgi:hypothetical protein